MSEPLEPRVARLAARYVEYYWPKREKKGGVPETPMNRKERGQSSPAIGEHGLDVVHANRRASFYLRGFLEDFYVGERKGQNRTFFSWILRRVEDDPGILQTWRAGKTSEDRRCLEDFYELMRQVARGALFTFGEKQVKEDLDRPERDENGEIDPLRFAVVVNPKDEQERQKTHEGRTLDAAHTDAEIVARLKEMEAYRGVKREEAKRLLADYAARPEWGYHRVDAAIKRENARKRGEVEQDKDVIAGNVYRNFSGEAGEGAA